jgi:shikimate dehydrogenase
VISGWDRVDLCEGADLVVNATSVGMSGGPVAFPRPLPLERLAPAARVVDLVYPRPKGGLLDRAEDFGARVQDGRQVLLWQGVAAQRLWFGAEPSAPAIAAMRRVLGLE